MSETVGYVPIDYAAIVRERVAGATYSFFSAGGVVSTTRTSPPIHSLGTYTRAADGPLRPTFASMAPYPSIVIFRRCITALLERYPYLVSLLYSGCRAAKMEREM